MLLARDGAEALQTADEHPGAIDLLLSDIVMPGFSGAEAALQLRPSRPGMKVLFISGYADAASAQRGMVGNGEGVLSKPFSSEALLSRVRTLLDRP